MAHIVIAIVLLLMRGSMSEAATANSDTLLRLDVGGSGITINVEAVPEKRIPFQGNDSTRLNLDVRTVGTTNSLFSTTVITSSGGGLFTGVTLTGLSSGTYDIAAKGYSHLRRTLTGTLLVNGSKVDFTSNGTNKLLCGDVNTGSLIPNGDNKVNGVDLTVMINGLLTASEKRDLNQDGKVNGVDLTCAITNLTKVGDD